MCKNAVNYTIGKFHLVRYRRKPSGRANVTGSGPADPGSRFKSQCVQNGSKKLISGGICCFYSMANRIASNSSIRIVYCETKVLVMVATIGWMFTLLKFTGVGYIYSSHWHRRPITLNNRWLCGLKKSNNSRRNSGVIGISSFTSSS